MLLKILQSGNPALRLHAKPLTPKTLRSKATQRLIDLMIDTLDDAPGVGLSAPQVGENIQLLIIHDQSKYHDQVDPKLLKEQDRHPVPLTVIANPRIETNDDQVSTYFEGCLSVEGYVAAVARAKSVRITGLDRQGKQINIDASGWYARILQHEVDHLNGILYIDRANLKSFMTLKNYSLNWRKKLQTSIVAGFK